MQDVYRTPMLLTPIVNDEKMLEKTIVLMMPTEAALIEQGDRSDKALMALAKFFLTDHPQSKELLDAIYKEQVRNVAEGGVVWHLAAFGLEEPGKKTVYVGNINDADILLNLTDKLTQYFADAKIAPVDKALDPVVFSFDQA